ncbi:hypothetical protein X797_005880 [Metarhizium robertsii]|uniref:Uncharacterized protein n=2 Tax=Metarhizium robertsii TaxID=568076 RepID=A0A0A1UV06_9HYPO|nr:hypothetical protein X797_005880 [Metarhizium robertsii]
MVDRGLCISPSAHACKPSNIWSASSAYPSPGHNTPRVQSPVSEAEYCRGNRLSLSGFSLPNLRSSSPSSNAIADTSNREIMAPGDGSDLFWYDGTIDADRRSPEPKDGPTFARAAQTFSSKRKASQFSLRSLTKSLSKRPRLVAFRQWAVNIYHDSSRRLTEAYRRLKHQRRFGEFRAWTGIGRRRQRPQPADDVKDKSAQPYGVFKYESGPGNQEWWKDGVTRYRAPSWMFRAK